MLAECGSTAQSKHGLVERGGRRKEEKGMSRFALALGA